MHSEPSRKEKRESYYYDLAEQGYFEIESPNYLYKSEEKRLKRDGLDTLRIVNTKNQFSPYKVSWKNAFMEGIPPIVYSYIIGEIETFPKVSNWAQELYVIAARANYLKAQTNNE